VFTVTYEAKDPAYVVEFSDISDIITSGVTLGVAFSNARTNNGARSQNE